MNSCSRLLSLSSREEAEALVNAHSYIVVLAKGSRSEGGVFYAYVAMQPDRYEAYHKAHLAKTPIKLEDFGTILYWQPEAEPSQAVKAYMAETYGISEQWLENVQDLLMQEVDASTLEAALGKIQQ